MKTRDIKTIDVNAREWFDRVNGNSYFSMNVTINYGMKTEQSFYVPMQYGYGDHYRHQAFEEIKKRLNCFKNVAERESYFRAYEKHKIIAKHSKVDSLKRDL